MTWSQYEGGGKAKQRITATALCYNPWTPIFLVMDRITGVATCRDNQQAKAIPFAGLPNAAILQSQSAIRNMANSNQSGSPPDSGEPQHRLKGLMSKVIKTLVGTGGGATAAAVGLWLGGPETALIGGAAGGAASAVVGMTLQGLGYELSSRVLGPREEARIGTVFTLAAAEIHERCNNGEKVREDGFFTPNEDGRSDAEEVWENVLLKSQREAEEKKLPYMAHLMANTAFDDTISAEMAHQLIKLAEDLTYRQLCILQLSVVKDRFNLRKGNYFDTDDFPTELRQILYEYHVLNSRALVSNGETIAIGIQEISPGNTMPQGLGVDLYNLMRLREIPLEDLQTVAVHLE